jgi:hypothetical protein
MTRANILDAVPLGRMRERPAGVANSIAWSLWHTARTEDLVVNAIARGVTQVAEGRASRLRVDEARIGTGFGDDEVAAVSDAIDLDELVAYRLDVSGEVRAWLAGVTQAELDAVPDVDARVAAGVVPEALRERWRGLTAGAYVSRTVVHGSLHLGEMMTVRGLLGIPSPP